MIDPNEPKNAPITFELNAYAVDLFAEWARLDGEYMRLAAGDRAGIEAIKSRREIMAEGLTGYLLSKLAERDPGGDLGDALRVRAEGYAAFAVANPKS